MNRSLRFFDYEQCYNHYVRSIESIRQKRINGETIVAKPVLMVALIDGIEANFPKVNDYRNIVVAEAMKVLGFVNRHSRGVLRVQKDLKANENGEAVYDFSYQTAVMVTESKSPRGERAMNAAIANGLVIEGEEKRSQKRSDLTIFDQKPSNMTENDEGKVQKPSFLTENEFPSMIVKNVYEALKINRKAKYSWLQDNLGVSESTILRAINDLKELGYINPEHSKIKGEWQLLK